MAEESLKDLKEENKKLLGRVDDIEENKLSIPDPIQRYQQDIIKHWRDVSETFIPTTATGKILEYIYNNNVVVISGPAGSGKSANAFHIAFNIESDGYEIISVTNPSDIFRYLSDNAKHVIIIEDFIGKYFLVQKDLELWMKEGPSILKFINGNTNVKLILTSRSYLLHSEEFQQLELCSSVYSLLSQELQLSLTERLKICTSYMNADEIKMLRFNEDTVMLFTSFPALCVMFSSERKGNIVDFFKNPCNYYKYELDQLRNGSKLIYFSLAFLAITASVEKSSFSIHSHIYDSLLQDMYNEFGLQQFPSKSLIQISLTSLTGSYVKDTGHSLTFINESMFDIVFHCISETFICTVVTHTSYSILNSRLQIGSSNRKKDHLKITLRREHEKVYFKRLLKELNESNWEIFDSEQFKLSEFRKKFISFLRRHAGELILKEKNDATTALHYISYLGYDEIAEFFIETNKSMVNMPNLKGNTPLHLASMEGHTKVVDKLIQHKAKVDSLNNDQFTPLYFACFYGYIDVVQVLVSDVDTFQINRKYNVNRKESSVLHIACKNNNSNITNTLLRHRASTESKDDTGSTPLHLACTEGHVNIAEILISFYAEINVLDNDDKTPLYLGCQMNHQNIVNLLTKKKANLNIKSKDGSTALSVTCKQGYLEICKQLLSCKNAKVNVKDKKGLTPLHEACLNGHEGIVELLLDHGAKINKPIKDSASTPLHLACQENKEAVGRILLNRKANPDLKDKYGWTPLLSSCAHGSKGILEMLLEKKVNINVSDNDGITPIIIACREGHYCCVKTLLKSRVEINRIDGDGCSALIIALQNGNEDIVSLLIENGSNVDQATSDGTTSLHIASKKNNINIISMLIAKGATVNAQNIDGQTPLFEACKNGCVETVEILLNYGALINHLDKSGESPVSIATTKDFHKIVSVLTMRSKIV